MTTTPKYKAKAVFWDTEKQGVVDSLTIQRYRTKGRLKLPDTITRFDSQHEFKVYLELCRMYGTEKVFSQFPVQIISPGWCYPRGKNWKIDFSIAGSQPYFGSSHFVEAKGAFLPEFAHTLASFEEGNDEAFRKLIIVFGNSIPKDNKVVKALLESEYAQNLLTLKELKQLTHLPSPL
jgi:hypothetical protein